VRLIRAMPIAVISMIIAVVSVIVAAVMELRVLVSAPIAMAVPILVIVPSDEQSGSRCDVNGRRWAHIHWTRHVHRRPDHDHRRWHVGGARNDNRQCDMLRLRGEWDAKTGQAHRGDAYGLKGECFQLFTCVEDVFGHRHYRYE